MAAVAYGDEAFRDRFFECRRTELRSKCCRRKWMSSGSDAFVGVSADGAPAAAAEEDGVLAGADGGTATGVTVLLPRVFTVAVLATTGP